MTDLTGQKFGRLTVLSYAGNYKWHCQCECGKEKDVAGGDLRNGSTKSCGCLRRELIHNSHMKDLTGQKFGRLTVLEEVKMEHNRRRNIHWRCLCDCGNEVIVKSPYLINGDTKSCGCLKSDTTANLTKTHGLSTGNCRLYYVWKTMRARCNNPNTSSYANYGGRGIKVCEAWNDFEEFYRWAINNGYDEAIPTNECTIDRIDTNGDYEPENCRWVSRKVQANNTRRNHMLTYNGETKTMSEWADIIGIPQKLLYNRVVPYNWTVERAITTPVKRNGYSESA